MESHQLSVHFFSSSMYFYSSLHTSSFWACVSDKIHGGTKNKIYMQCGLEKYAEEGKKVCGEEKKYAGKRGKKTFACKQYCTD